MTRLIYRKAPLEGDPEQIQTGDAISYREGGKFLTGKVEEIHVEDRFLLLAAVQYGGRVLRPPRKLSFEEMLKAERKTPELGTSPPEEQPAVDLP